MTTTFPLFAGLLAAMLHVISGPDHLAAVMPFAIESKRKAWKVGLFWGIGHLLGMFFIGMLFLLFKELIPIESISAYSETLVGFILVLLGCWILYRIFFQRKQHKHTHVHAISGPAIHTHTHMHNHDKHHHHHHHVDLKQNVLASLSFGVVHGFAGIAHFILFLPVLGFEQTTNALFYIIGFCLGTLIAMIAFAFVIGRVSDYSKNEHTDTFFKGIRLAGGLFALCIGIYWIVAN